jgi:hypothetical protein
MKVCISEKENCDANAEILTNADVGGGFAHA